MLERAGRWGPPVSLQLQALGLKQKWISKDDRAPDTSEFPLSLAKYAWEEGATPRGRGGLGSQEEQVEEKEAVTALSAAGTFGEAGKETQVLDLARLRPSLTRTKATAEKLWGVRPPEQTWEQTAMQPRGDHRDTHHRMLGTTGLRHWLLLESNTASLSLHPETLPPGLFLGVSRCKTQDPRP